ncbi:predicted protein [Aspergillus terreus NIH2624]|uniref:Uncharacterized protein n=1 Tax=Aspergillus terreus (strain NIH 2624 / FGSC A1156) TaxID=341663 RepID=Q0CHC7_ASPTN|nr:uncharacterized protein ATEG_06915 [Aspergillus terreus NIH2624]EAU32299.1 predicted protein [Aspergillus terreus NIH2624]
MLGALSHAASPTMVFCKDANFGGTCVNLPVVSDSCVDFKGGLSFLYHEVSSVRVPSGFVCSLSRYYGCTNSEVFLISGSYSNLFSAPTVYGTTNFNDLTASVLCSPI